MTKPKFTLEDIESFLTESWIPIDYQRNPPPWVPKFDSQGRMISLKDQTGYPVIEHYEEGWCVDAKAGKLIAAAPDLLEACISALEPLETLCLEYADIQPFIDKIRAALVKVEIYPPIPNYE